MLHPQAFEALYYMVTRFNADVAAFRNKPFPTILSWAKRKITIWKNWNTGSAPRRSKTFCRPQNGRGGSVLVWNRLYNKAAVKGLEFPVNVQPAEDTTYTLKVLFQIKSMVSTDAEFCFTATVPPRS